MPFLDIFRSNKSSKAKRCLSLTLGFKGGFEREEDEAQTRQRRDEKSSNLFGKKFSLGFDFFIFCQIVTDIRF